MGPPLVAHRQCRRFTAPAKAGRAVSVAGFLRANGISVAEVAERLRVSPSTLYRHLPGGRGAIG